MIYMPKRNNSLNQTPSNQICLTKDIAYLILLDQLKAIELQAEKIRDEARILQTRIKNDNEQESVFYSAVIEIMTIELAERTDRVGKLYRAIVQPNKNKEEVAP
jgi:hypothetical protein